MNDLPEKGWAGYGSPSHPLTPRLRMKPYPNRTGVCIHEIHAEIAECRLEREGVLPELLAYIVGIGASARG